MVRVSAESTAPASAVWAIYAFPSRWHEWAPQIRGAEGLDGEDGEVRAGARGVVKLLGFVPVPATIVRVERGRVWTWRVGGIEMDHEVVPAPGGGSEVGIAFRAPRAVEAALAVSYAPVCKLLMANLARVAARG